LVCIYVVWVGVVCVYICMFGVCVYVCVHVYMCGMCVVFAIFLGRSRGIWRFPG